MAYARTDTDIPVQLQQGGKVLALGSGATFGADAGSLMDLSGVPATSTLVSYADALTAGTTQSQAGGLPITAEISRFTTTAHDHDCGTLPVSVPGTQLTIINAGAHILDVYPNAAGTTTETINALSANAAFSMSATKVAMFYCTVAGQWHTILTA
jgi:hypothetical protein